MQKSIKNIICYMSSFVAAVSLVTVALGNTNVLAQSQAQSCINGDGVNCNNAPSSPSASPSASPSPGSPVITFTSNPTTVEYGSNSQLSWSVTNATSCTASGGWNGARLTQGKEFTQNLQKSTSYTLTCSGVAGTSTKSISISVKPNVSISLSSGSSNPQHFESRLKKTDRCGWSLWLVFTTVCLTQETIRVPASWAFTVVRSGDISEPASVTWKLLPDGSTPVSVPSDFINSASGTLNFRAGVRAVGLSINSRNDWSFEAEKEYFKICLDNTQSSGIFVGSSPLCDSSFIRDDDGPCEDNAVSQFDLLLRLVCVLTVDTIVLTLTIPVAIASLVSLSVVGIAVALLTGRVDGVTNALNALSANLNIVSDKVRRATTALLSNPPITQLPLF
jgi:hypothetical protein